MLTEKELEEVLHLAEELQNGAKPSQESDFADRMEPILKSPTSKHFLIRLMDVAFRSNNNKRVSDYVLNLFRTEDTHNDLFNALESVLVKLYRTVGHYFPSISIPLMLTQIRQVTAPILFFLGDPKFSEHVVKRREGNVKLNVNLIGEALIGEQEATERILAYKELLRDDDVDYISIKISTIYSQITSLAYEHSVTILVAKLSELYDELLDIHAKTEKWKFVNLDMEEYRDLHMTLDTFKQTLSLEKYKNLRAGIVLQAYLPDSYKALVELQDFANERVANGGAAIKVRLVKGANMEMEKTESSIEDWEVAPYTQKVHTDANYKKALLHLFEGDNLKSLNLGIASHNIFDLAFALYQVKKRGLQAYVDFEMLEGMANDTVLSLLSQGANVLLYTPIVKKENYNSAMAYLVRRLDEGTQDGNFLKEGFGLTVGSEKWDELKRQFLSAVEIIPTVKDEPFRRQNRATETYLEQSHFYNIANTDWTLKANRKWMTDVKAKWNSGNIPITDKVPVVTNLGERKREAIEIEGWNGEPNWKYELADEADYTAFINSKTDWHQKTAKEKAVLLRRAAVEIEKNRSDLIAVAVTELGKTIAEVDVEVSEAIDFANYYAASILKLDEELEFEEKEGINLVLSPWNFPVAIPIGGVLASLAAGKRVILKPSTNAAATAYLTSKCLWNAGIPNGVFGFMPTKEECLDAFLSTGNTFDAVILTGGTDTAKFLLKRNPTLNLYAETGGKNSTIVTALSDRDQAVKNAVQSAFGNAGQKCSATSLLILEEEVFNDAHFKQLLLDATKSRFHGNPWNYETQIGPLAAPISSKLKQVLADTPEEKWLLKPILEGEFMLSPGIIWGVTKKDFAYQNELFGPILSVMKAKNLTKAIDLVNGVDYGLTSGIESLDKEEVLFWKGKIRAGNLYANRPTTGAIVQRQPFGGMKASCFGFGMKAGGLNYVLQFLTPIVAFTSMQEIEKDYQKWAEELFNKEIDYANLRGQRNLNSYLKPNKVLVLIDRNTSLNDIGLVNLAAKTLQIEKVYVSFEEMKNVKQIKSITEFDKEVNNETVIRSLVKEKLPSEFIDLCHLKATHIYDRKPSASGRMELLNYLTEQNFSYNYHRYGNLMGEDI